MLSEMLASQVALTDRDRGDSTTVGDDIAISVHNVGKMYTLCNRPQDRLKQAFLWSRRKLYREFWALRDVSFCEERGDCRHYRLQRGGKTTLLLHKGASQWIRCTS